MARLHPLGRTRACPTRTTVPSVCTPCCSRRVSSPSSRRLRLSRNPAYGPHSCLARPCPYRGGRRPESMRALRGFFAAQIRNPSTRRAYVRAVNGFLGWCHLNGMEPVIDAEPLHVAARLDCRRGPASRRRVSSSAWPPCGTCSTGRWSARSCRRIPRTPSAAHAVRCGPARPQSPRRMKPEVLMPRRRPAFDRALIALMAYSFARIGAVIGMKVEDISCSAPALGEAARERRQGP